LAGLGSAGLKVGGSRVGGPRPARGGDRGINTLLSLVAVLMVRDMRATREQKEANTVERNLWSQPSYSVMPFRLAISYVRGTGQVPV
jgi:hypothetical protein